MQLTCGYECAALLHAYRHPAAQLDKTEDETTHRKFLHSLRGVRRGGAKCCYWDLTQTYLAVPGNVCPIRSDRVDPFPIPWSLV